jgi:hypothetical protein
MSGLTAKAYPDIIGFNVIGFRFRVLGYGFEEELLSINPERGMVNL